MDNEDKVLFREFVKGIKPFKQDKITFTSKRKQVIKQKQQIKEIREKEDALFYFSDEYEPLLDTQTMRYLREGEDSYVLKRLRRGDFIPDLFLDLHGLTKEQAKQELASLILACERDIYPALVL